LIEFDKEPWPNSCATRFDGEYRRSCGARGGREALAPKSSPPSSTNIGPRFGSARLPSPVARTPRQGQRQRNQQPRRNLSNAEDVQSRDAALLTDFDVPFTNNLAEQTSG